MRLAVLAAVVLALAGCAGGPDEAPAAAPTPTPEAAPEAADIPQAPTQVLQEVAWEGRTKEGAWVCSDASGTGQCPAGQQVLPDGDHVTSVAYEGNLTRVELTMTWSPADPTQAGLVLAVYGNTSSGLAPLGWARGASTFSLAIEGDALAGVLGDGALVLMAWPEGKTATQPSLFVDATRQTFRVEGTLTTVLPAP